MISTWRVGYGCEASSPPDSPGSTTATIAATASTPPMMALDPTREPSYPVRGGSDGPRQRRRTAHVCARAVTPSSQRGGRDPLAAAIRGAPDLSADDSREQLISLS